MNTYSLNARVYPVLLAILPVLVLGIIFFIETKDIYESLSSLGISAVLYFLFAQLGRDRGRKLQNKLWAEWGGPPSTILFRYSDNTIDPVTKNLYHKKMQKLIPSVIVPSKELEEQSIDTCDVIYLSWSKYLISQTRDTSNFKLLFSENVNYGFRRNAWGLKPFSVILIIILSIILWIANYLTFDTLNLQDPNYLISQFILLIFLSFWLFIVNKSWVKITAYAYAERLLESIVTISKEYNNSNNDQNPHCR